jgi:hypothetical protein
MADLAKGSTDLSNEQAATDIVSLLQAYCFDGSGYTANQLLTHWTKNYPVNWVRLAIIEALYQGRYKAVSVDQILSFWQRRRSPIYHFNHEFERLVCHQFPRRQIATPMPEAAPLAIFEPKPHHRVTLQLPCFGPATHPRSVSELASLKAELDSETSEALVDLETETVVPPTLADEPSDRDQASMEHGHLEYPTTRPDWPSAHSQPHTASAKSPLTRWETLAAPPIPPSSQERIARLMLFINQPGSSDSGLAEAAPIEQPVPPDSQLGECAPVNTRNSDPIPQLLPPSAAQHDLPDANGHCLEPPQPTASCQSDLAEPAIDVPAVTPTPLTNNPVEQFKQLAHLTLTDSVQNIALELQQPDFYHKLRAVAQLELEGGEPEGQANSSPSLTPQPMDEVDR